ncbi:MAG: hypothetical protein WC536_02695 [Patescibacteria group bacterium]
MLEQKAIDCIVSEVRRKLALQKSGEPQTRTTQTEFATLLDLKAREVCQIVKICLTEKEQLQWRRLPLQQWQRGPKFWKIIEYARSCLAEVRRGNRSFVPTLRFIGKEFNLSRERARQVLAAGLTEVEIRDWKRYSSKGRSKKVKQLREQSKETTNKQNASKRLIRYCRFLILLLRIGRIKRLPSMPTIAKKLEIGRRVGCYLMEKLLTLEERSYWSRSVTINRVSACLSEEAKRFRDGEIDVLPAKKDICEEFGVSGSYIYSVVIPKLSSADQKIWRSY